jgi:hypothetical protein
VSRRQDHGDRRLESRGCREYLGQEQPRQGQRKSPELSLEPALLLELLFLLLDFQ